MDMHFVNKLFQLVDEYSANFVAETYQNIVNQNANIIYLFVTVYIGINFISMQRGAVNGNDFIYSVLKVVFILSILFNYEYFYLFVYDIFTDGPLVICKAITIHGDQASSLSIPSALDQLMQDGFDQGHKIIGIGGWSNFTFSAFGYLVIGVTFAAVACAMYLIFLSKIATAILLAISPIFFFFAIYDSTKGWFDSYIQHLVGYALIPIMTCAVSMITLSITNTTLLDASSQTVSLKLIIPFLMACTIQLWLYAQINTKCASLASGFNLKSFSGSLKDIKDGIKNTAEKLLKAGNLIGKASRKVGSVAARSARTINKWQDFMSDQDVG